MSKSSPVDWSAARLPGEIRRAVRAGHPDPFSRAPRIHIPLPAALAPIAVPDRNLCQTENVGLGRRRITRPFAPASVYFSTTCPARRPLPGPARATLGVVIQLSVAKYAFHSGRRRTCVKACVQRGRNVRPNHTKHRARSVYTPLRPFCPEASLIGKLLIFCRFVGLARLTTKAGRNPRRAHARACVVNRPPWFTLPA